MKLNRNRNQRKALMRTQLSALVNFGHLTTTLAKVGTVASRRLLARDLASVASANRLVDVIATLFPDRISGYTSSTKNKIRRGDAVTMVTLKLMADLPVPVVKEEKKVKVDKKVATKTTEKKVKTAKK